MKARILIVAGLILISVLVLLSSGCNFGDKRALEARVGELEARAAELQTKNGELENELVSANATITQLTREKSQLEKDLAEKNQLIAGLQNKPIKGGVVVSFEPNPVPSINNSWRFDIILSNKGDTRVSIKKFVMERYASDGQMIDTKDIDITKMPSTVIPAGGSIKTGAGFPSDRGNVRIAYTIYALSFADANGGEIEAEGRVNLTPGPNQ